MLLNSYVKAFSDIFDSVVFDKCCLTTIGASLLSNLNIGETHDKCLARFVTN